MSKYDKKNQQLARKYGAVTLPYNKLPRPYQLSIAYYMAIDGEAWGIPDEIMHHISNHYPKASYTKNREEYKKQWKEYREQLVRLLVKNIHFYIEEDGKQKFKKANIPTAVLMREIFERHVDIRADNPTFEDYMKSYEDYTTVPDHSRRNRWPVIMSGFDDDIIEDGWHRFHCYITQKQRTIPCVFFV